MSSDGSANRQRYLPTTHPGEGREPLSDENAEWLTEQTTSLDSLVTLARVRQANADLELAVYEATAAENAKTALLRYLAMRGESATETYDTLAEVTSASRRTVRHYVSELEQDGIVERSDGRPKRVAWSCPAAYLIATDLFASLDRTSGL